MSGPVVARPPVSTRATRAALAVGVAVAIACFTVAIVLETLERPDGGGAAIDLAAVLRSAAALEPWGWATLGTFAVIVTPVAAIVATAIEYARAGDRRTAWTAIGVLCVLALSLVVSLVGR